jgi:hypothetical protein
MIINDFYTFIVSSTINAVKKDGVNIIDNQKRFLETVETLDSIHRKIPDVRIILIDNSIESLTEEQKNIIKEKVDIFKEIQHNIFTKFVNEIGSKGMGEAYLMYEAIKIIKENNLVGKRIFKISGRYRLADSFDISYFEKPELFSKYAFKINQWDVSTDNFKTNRERVVYFETRLWSFCASLFEEYEKIMLKIFYIMASNIGRPLCNWEIGHWQNIPINKVHEIEVSHVEGITSDTGVYKFE